ncbi:MAG: D-alanine--D-alanine ligase [bacterium]
MSKQHIAVFMGGPSFEYDVSMASGREVCNTLQQNGYSVTSIHVDKNGEWSLPIQSLIDNEMVAFLALRGAYGEDGTVQDILQLHNIPFIGSDALSSALGMHKILSSNLFYAHGFDIPRFIEVHKNSTWPVFEGITFPVIIKPADSGSSLGITVIRSYDDISAALETAFMYSRTVLIQQFVIGKEVSCAVLDNGDGIIFALPPIEIISNTNEFCDYSAKYAPYGSEHRVLKTDESKRVMTTAVALHKLIVASGMTRSDMIITDDGMLYVLEINTLPDLTATSIMRKAAYSYGMTFPELLDSMIHTALKRHENRK